MKKFISKINFPKIKTYVLAHKVISVVVLLIIIFIGYKIISGLGNTSGEIKYVVGTVEKGNLLSSVSSTGTVSSSDQVDLKSKVSGDIISIVVKSGQEVKKGEVIARIDSTDAYNALRSSQISLEKLTQAADETDMIQAQNSLSDAINSDSQAYDNGLNDVASAFLVVPDVITGLDSMLGGLGGFLSSNNVLYFGDTARQYRDQAGTSFNLAKDKYNSLLSEYKTVSRTSASSSVVALVSHTYDMAKAVSQALKDTKGALDYIKNQNSNQTASQISAMDSASTNLSTWTDKINPRLASLLSDKSDLSQSSGNIADKQAVLAKLIRGADPLDIESAQLAVDIKYKTYSDYTIVAPFDGVIGRIPVKVGDSASNGTVMATIITKEQMADVSLNEVDAAKVKVGDKATLTFDAVEGLTLTGVVSDLDLVGTTNQGVVNYGAKIVFDTNDIRVRSGMSTSAEIITNVLTDVLYVSSSAVKTDDQGSYVLVFNPPLSNPMNTGTPSAVPPTSKSVEIGASNDTSTEIKSGLSEGDQVVTRTINPTTATTQAPSIFGATTGGARTGTGTGNVRVTGATGR